MNELNTFETFLVGKFNEIVGTGLSADKFLRMASFDFEAEEGEYVLPILLEDKVIYVAVEKLAE